MKAYSKSSGLINTMPFNTDHQTWALLFFLPLLLPPPLPSSSSSTFLPPPPSTLHPLLPPLPLPSSTLPLPSTFPSSSSSFLLLSSSFPYFPLLSPVSWSLAWGQRLTSQSFPMAIDLSISGGGESPFSLTHPTSSITIWSILTQTRLLNPLLISFLSSESVSVPPEWPPFSFSFPQFLLVVFLSEVADRHYSNITLLKCISWQRKALHFRRLKPDTWPRAINL